MKSVLFMMSLLLVVALCLNSCTQKEPNLIPRQTFFGNPDKAGLSMSHDGKYISYRAPLNGVMNVWVAPANEPQKAEAVTADSNRGIRIYFWAYDNKHIIYLQDEGGDENWVVHAVNIETRDDKNLTPFDEILDESGKPIILPNGKKLRPRAQIQEVSPKYPDEILIGLNKRNPQLFDIYRLNILSGDLKMIEKNDKFVGYTTNDDFDVVLASEITPDGGNVLYKKGPKGKWVVFTKIDAADLLTTSPIMLSKNNDTLYMVDSRGRNTAALTAMDLKTGKSKVIFDDPRADVEDFIIQSKEKKIQAVAVNYERVTWKILDPSIEKDINYLKGLVNGDLNITSRTEDDKYWTVAFVQDVGPVRYYLYDRDNQDAKFMFTNRTQLEGLKLSKMHPVVIKSRDNKNLVSYLTLPYWTDADDNGRPDKPLPMVLFVHGGPWYRDSWGYDSYHQWLANRGYAVLSVNFRGSTGFGKDFINAANMEWGGKMHTDLIDAVNWAVDQKVAMKDKVAIMGGSYGGYATLVGLTFTPNVFVCGVDICGPSNLRTLLESIPPYWKPMLDMFTTRVGDNRTEEGRVYLDSISPLSYVDSISKPLLIGQGANDPRVKQSEADQIVKVMEEKKIPVTYVLFPDEGHGFARPENNLAFNAVTEIFLSQYLGGRSEPIGNDFSGSSITVPEGAGDVPGLEAALKK